MTLLMTSTIVDRAQAGCGLYTQHGSDIRIITTAELLQGARHSSFTYQQFFEMLRGYWGEPEPLCSGPNCGRPTIPFSAPISETIVVRISIPSGLAEKGEALAFLLQPEAIFLTESKRCLAGYLRSIEHPPKVG